MAGQMATTEGYRFKFVLLLVTLVLGTRGVQGQDGWTGLVKAITDVLTEILKPTGIFDGVYKNILTDPGVVGRFLEAQLWVTDVNATLPTNPLLNLNPGFDAYKLSPCPRKDVITCVYHGNSSNGLPKAVQGAWWQDGIEFDEELIIPVGEWDPELRMLVIRATAPRNWGAHYTSSVKDKSGLFWLPSGAAHTNFGSSLKVRVFIFFNEDITFGQIVGSATVLNTFTIPAPVFLNNWTMELLPDGSWKRESVVLGLYTPSGNYFLRSVTDGEGNPGPYYDKWLLSRGGAPFSYVVQAEDRFLL